MGNFKRKIRFFFGGGLPYFDTDPEAVYSDSVTFFLGSYFQVIVVFRDKRAWPFVNAAAYFLQVYLKGKLGQTTLVVGAPSIWGHSRLWPVDPSPRKRRSQEGPGKPNQSSEPPTFSTMWLHDAKLGAD